MVKSAVEALVVLNLEEVVVEFPVGESLEEAVVV